MITAAQLRAARGLLDWTRNELADAAKISPETVKNIEHGVFRPQEQTAEAIVRAFASHDVVFTEDEGVKIQTNQIKTFSGKQGYIEFLDHVYETVKGGGRIRQFNVSDATLSYAAEYSAIHMKRMEKISNLDARVLTGEGDYNFSASSYCAYKWLTKEHKIIIPYYVYGDYLSLASTKNESDRELISIHSKLLTDLYTEQFDVIWNNASIPKKKAS